MSRSRFVFFAARPATPGFSIVFFAQACMMGICKVFIQVLEPYARLNLDYNQGTTHDKQKDVHAWFPGHLVDLSATTAEAEWNAPSPHVNFSCFICHW
jgi:hypothetical protein